MPSTVANHLRTEPAPAAAMPRRSVATTASTQHWVRWFADRTGLCWQCYDAVSGNLVSRSDTAQTSLAFRPANVIDCLADIHEISFFDLEQGLSAVALPLPGAPDSGYVLCSYFLTESGARPLELTLAAAAQGWSELAFDRYLARCPVMSRAIAERLIELLDDTRRTHDRCTNLAHEVGALSQQLDYAFDELRLLHVVTENLQLARSVRDLGRICVDRIHSLIDAAGHLLVIEDARHGVHQLVAGAVGNPEGTLQRALQFAGAHDWTRPFIGNNLGPLRGGESVLGLESVIVARIGDERRHFGWIVSCNLHFGQFGAVEANLLQSVARLLTTHGQNWRLYSEQDEMLIGFVRSLVSTLDAKDAYTRGHSERVALVARRLGQALDLPESELNDIYLSSLLHDIGKIGVDDRILRKPEQLTEEEFAQVQQHPVIGEQILRPLTRLQHILPGVRSHHEACNGRGYPDRLKSDQIPLMARIIAVADSYDAMISDRPYRRGMPLERVEEIFRRGSGEQWDRRVIDAYFAVREDIRRLCESYSLSGGNLLADADADSWTGIGSRRLPTA